MDDTPEQEIAELAEEIQHDIAAKLNGCSWLFSDDQATKIKFHTLMLVMSLKEVAND